jgi:hypothetical protein
LLWLLLPFVKALPKRVSAKSNSTGRNEIDFVIGISMPPPMMKSNALLLGDLTTNAPRTILFQIASHIRVCATEHGLNEGLNVRCAEFDYWPNVVGKQIALRTAGADTATERGIRKVEIPRLASIAFELSLDPNHAVEEIRESSATAVQ